MFAVIRTGGKQYRVAPDDIIRIEKIDGSAGDIVEIGDVLMVGDGARTEVGAPLVQGATVAAEVLEQTRGDKIVVFKKKRRKNYRRTAGHRQHLTVLRVTEILTGGKKPSKTGAKAAPAGKTAAAGKKAPAGTKAAAAKEKKAPAKPAAKKAAPARKAAAKKDPAKKDG